jgi:formate dehydrogenase subunit gamma
MRILSILLLALTMALPAAPLVAQEGTAPVAAPEEDRAATGGAMTREEIMARQRGEEVPTRERGADDTAGGAAAAIRGQLGPLGQTSDSEVWEQLRFGTADVTVSAGGPEARVLVQDSGMPWYEFRAGPLRTYGGYLLLGMLGVLAVFYLIRGRIRIEHGRAGVTVLRFDLMERTGHWVLAVSFIVLGLTGLITLFGRVAFIPLFGKEAFATFAMASKWLHNWVAWPFMAALVVVFLMWVLRNIPNKHDLIWLAKGGGLFSKGVHPPSKKFNAGQKIIFWAVIVLGVSVSASGLSLLMPFELPLFAKTFTAMNGLGLPGLFGLDPLPEQLTPHAEMQLATLWHAIVAFVMMAIILAHIYLGSVGMEGAFDAMGTGRVDLNWAREHHNLWVEELEQKGAVKAAGTPAE